MSRAGKNGMPERSRKTGSGTGTMPQGVTDPLPVPEGGAAVGSPAPSPRRRVEGWLRRPFVFVPLLLLAGVLAGYAAGLLRLAAGERRWEARRAELDRTVTGLESTLRKAQGQEASYRALVSISRVVVDLYDRNFGLAAEEIRRARTVLAAVPRSAASGLDAKLAVFETELDDLSRRIEEMSRTARDTMRDVEREVTALLFPDGS